LTEFGLVTLEGHHLLFALKAGSESPSLSLRAIVALHVGILIIKEKFI